MERVHFHFASVTGHSTDIPRTFHGHQRPNWTRKPILSIAWFQWLKLSALKVESRSPKIERGGFRWLEMIFKNLILFHLISGHFLISCNFEQFWKTLNFLKRWSNFIFHGFIALNANLMSVYKIPCYKFPGMFFVEKTWIIYGVQDSNFDVKSRRF